MAKSQKQGRQEAAGGNGSGTRKTPAGAAGQDFAADRKQDAEALLRSDHRRVEELCRKFEAAGDGSSDSKEKKELVTEICRELIVHSRLEEEVFYPACRRHGVEDELLDEAQVEHDSLKLLVGDLLGRQPGSSFYDAKVAVLSEYVKHHVAEEEKAGSGIFAKARAAGVDMDGVGERILQRKQQLTEEMQGEDLEAPRPRSFNVQTGGFNRSLQETGMARSYERDRDEGRYRQEDDRGMFGSRHAEYRDGGGERYGRREAPSEGGRMREGGWSGYQEGRSRNSRQSYWEERDRAGGYYGGGSPGSSRREGGGYSGGRYRGGYADDDDYYSGGRGYTGSAGSREDYGRPGRGGFERERDEYGRFMGGEDRGRMGWRKRDDDESYVRGGGQARFGNRAGNYPNEPGDDAEEDDYRRRRGSSEYEGRSGRSGGMGGWRNRE